MFIDIAQIERLTTPPDGLSLMERARWWAGNPQGLQLALEIGKLKENTEEWDAILRVGKDVDLAHKIIDRKKVFGLSVEERSRIFELLTDGGSWTGAPKKGRKQLASRDLKIAIALEGVADPREINRIARSMSGNRYHSDNVSKLKSKAQALYSKFNDDDLVLVKKIIMTIEENMTEETLNCMVELAWQMKAQQPDMFEAWLNS